MNQWNKTILPAINYHLWKPCNMNCKFCFATFNDTKEYLPIGHLNEFDSLRLVDEIIDSGFSKITFAGGEPTLCKWLPTLIDRAKSGGLTTMIVSNGFFLTEKYLDELKGRLDWITISIDSIKPEVNFSSGRFCKDVIPDKKYYNNILFNIKNKGFRLKINTVVSKLNYLDELGEFIIKANPERWKVFQVLPIRGQNDKFIDELIISQEMFDKYVQNHQFLKNIGIDVVFENNNAMIGSYLMIDPAGRFYDNVHENYFYSSPILEVGVKKAYQQVKVDYDKFIMRQGLYNWGEMKCDL